MSGKLIEKTADKFLREVLGNNMNVSTLSVNFWNEVMTEYANHVYKARIEANGDNKKGETVLPIQDIVFSEERAEVCDCKFKKSCGLCVLGRLKISECGDYIKQT